MPHLAAVWAAACGGLAQHVAEVAFRSACVPSGRGSGGTASTAAIAAATRPAMSGAREALKPSITARSTGET
jgi:hypothetical protein